jgi:hypothetical protein
LVIPLPLGNLPLFTMRNSLLVAAIFAVLLPSLPAQDGWSWPYNNDEAGPFAQEDLGAGGLYGYDSCPIGDINGDNTEDFAISAPGATNPNAPGMSGFRAGAVFVNSGDDGSLLYAIYGDSAGAQLGHSIVSLRPKSGQSFLAISQPYTNTSSGFATGRVGLYLPYETLPYATIEGSASGDLFGFDLAAIDWDGDPYTSELAIGIPGFGSAMAGSVEIYDVSGGTFTFLTSFEGTPGSNDSFGTSLAAVPTGFAFDPDRLFVGSSGTVQPTNALDRAGSVHLLMNGNIADPFSAPIEILREYGDVEGAQLGWSVASGYSLADTHGAGYVPDFSAGAPGGLATFAPTAGYVKSWEGFDLSAMPTLQGDFPGDQLGYSMTMLPDTNNNVTEDIAVGIPGYKSPSGAEMGQVRVYDFDTAIPSINASFGDVKARVRLGFSTTQLDWVDDDNSVPNCLVMGGIFSGNDTGMALISGLPDPRTFGELTLSISDDTPFLEVDFTLDVTQAEPNATLEWFIVPPSGPGQPISIGTGMADPNGVASLTYRFDDSNYIGVTFDFYAEETVSGAISDSVSGTVTRPEMEIQPTGALVAGQNVQLETEWGTADAQHYYYYSTANTLGNDTVLIDGVQTNTGLTDPQLVFGSPFTASNPDGYSITGVLPIAGNYGGVKVWFSVVDVVAVNYRPYAVTDRITIQQP